MIADFFILIINFLITLICGIISWIVNILPTSPFAGITLDVPSEFMGYVNYFLPVNLMMPVLLAWGTCIVGYKFIKWIMHILRIE